MAYETGKLSRKHARAASSFEEPVHIDCYRGSEVACHSVRQGMERLQRLTTEDAQAAVADPAERVVVVDELADIIVYCLRLSHALDLDVSSAVLGKRGPKRSV